MTEDTIRYPGGLVPGSFYLWAGMPVEVLEVEARPVRNWQRNARDPGWYITARLPLGEVRRLHYWSNERVTVVG